jgi:hypothetical protein
MERAELTGQITNQHVYLISVIGGFENDFFFLFRLVPLSNFSLRNKLLLYFPKI